MGLCSTRHTLPPLAGELGTVSGGYDTSDSDEKYSPVWYDRSSGWTGQTFDEAALFCSGKGLNNDICPYEAICPEGPLNPPYGGIKDEPSWAWAPINEPFNSWVQVSNWQSCTQYKDLNPNDSPIWGLTGSNNEDLTRHIACCEMDDAEEIPRPCQLHCLRASQHRRPHCGLPVNPRPCQLRCLRASQHRCLRTIQLQGLRPDTHLPRPNLARDENIGYRLVIKILVPLVPHTRTCNSHSQIGPWTVVKKN